MSVSEQERHQLYIAVESAIGAEGAATLMEYLPPIGWADVARKDDIAAVRRDIAVLDEKWSERLDGLEQRWSERLDAQDEQLSMLDQRWSERLSAQDEQLSMLDQRWSERLSAQDERTSALDERWDNRMESLEHRLTSKIDTLRAEFYRSQEAQIRLVVFGMITMVVAVAALAFGAARLA